MIWQTRQLLSALVRRYPLAKELMSQHVLGALRPISPVIAVDRGGRRMFVPTSDRGEIARAVFATGTYEADAMRVAMAVVARYTGRPRPLADRVFVDVGANIGVSTIEALLSHDARAAIAFEPNPAAYDILRHNLLANDIFERCVTRQQAVSDFNGEIPLELAPDNWGDHRVRTHGGNRQRPTVTVPVTTLAAALADAEIAPNDVGCLWIDIQGHEASALAGAAPLLAAGVPIVCEYWPYGLRETGGYEPFWEWVRAAIGTVVDLADPDRELSAISAPASADGRLSGTHSHTNFVMLPRDRTRDSPAAAQPDVS